MRTQTRILSQPDLAEALAREEPDVLELPGLVDLRHKGPLLDQTQVLDEVQLRRIRSEYEALRGPGVKERSEEPVPEDPKPRRSYRLIAALLAVLGALVAYNLSRSWGSAKQVARAATPPAALPSPPERVAAAPARERPTRAAAADLPRTALAALATGDRERARGAYAELALHEPEPGPYSVAAAILARELKARQ